MSNQKYITLPIDKLGEVIILALNKSLVGIQVGHTAKAIKEALIENSVSDLGVLSPKQTLLTPEEKEKFFKMLDDIYNGNKAFNPDTSEMGWTKEEENFFKKEK